MDLRVHCGCQCLESCSLSSGCHAYCPEGLPLSRHLLDPPLPLASCRCCSGWLEGCCASCQLPALLRLARGILEFFQIACRVLLRWTGSMLIAPRLPLAFAAKYGGTRADRSRGMRLVWVAPDQRIVGSDVVEDGSVRTLGGPESRCCRTSLSMEGCQGTRADRRKASN